MDIADSNSKARFETWIYSVLYIAQISCVCSCPLEMQEDIGGGFSPIGDNKLEKKFVTLDLSLLSIWSA